MKLTLNRSKPSAKSMIGSLYVDGVFECYTLEDIPRINKIAGQTAIPAGTYKVIINMSNRFKVLMPLLLNVPNFEGVRMHTGNSGVDTEGCILVGRTQAIDFIGQSKLAYKKLFDKMQKAIADGEVIILTIT